MKSKKTALRIISSAIRVTGCGLLMLASSWPAQAQTVSNPLLQSLINQTRTRKQVPPSGNYLWPHRGLYGPTAKGSLSTLTGVPENSIAAVNRAVSWGAKAVEIDVRLSADGVPMVIHDQVTNGYTNWDNALGQYNPYEYIKWGIQAPTVIDVNEQNSQTLRSKRVKVYAPGSNMTVTSSNLQSLAEFLAALPSNAPLIILDLQTPGTTLAAAKAVRAAGKKDSVILKFFARTAVETIDSGPKESQFQKLINHWGNDLWYIIQFNDGELTDQLAVAPNANVASIYGFGNYWDPINYANYFIATGRVIGVGLSYPVTSNATSQTLQRASLNRLSKYFSTDGTAVPTIGIVINPDNSWKDVDNSCILYRFGTNGDANNRYNIRPYSFFNYSSKNSFGFQQEYAIADALPKQYSSGKDMVADEYNFTQTFCNSAVNSHNLE